MAKTTTKNHEAHTVAGEWHLIDANNKVLGRLANDVAKLLSGKHRTDWIPNKVAPVFVVVINTDKVALTGRKEDQKTYYSYSGYPGGISHRTVREQRARDSRFIVREAISGMLPKNNSRAEKLRHLKLYKNNEHPHEAQLNNSDNAK